MKLRSGKKTTEKPENPRAAAVRRIMTIAQLIRQRGTPDEALEALSWERQLEDRLRQIESQIVSQAA